MKNERVFSVLRDVAVDSPATGGSRVACAIVRNKSIIAIGTNQRKTHPLQKRYGKNAKAIYLHAEISAISRARYRVDLTGCQIYVVRIMADHSFGLAKPCGGCIEAINDHGIPELYFTE